MYGAASSAHNASGSEEKEEDVDVSTDSKPGDYYRLTNVLAGDLCSGQYASLGQHRSRASRDNSETALTTFNALVHAQYHDNSRDEYDGFQ